MGQYRCSSIFFFIYNCSNHLPLIDLAHALGKAPAKEVTRCSCLQLLTFNPEQQQLVHYLSYLLNRRFLNDYYAMSVSSFFNSCPQGTPF